MPSHSLSAVIARRPDAIRATKQTIGASSNPQPSWIPASLAAPRNDAKSMTEN
jgi:hypothetical protein